jgi:hypothetical protein
MIGMGLSLRLTVTLECKVCGQSLNTKKRDEDLTNVALFGRVEYAQCPSCLQIVPFGQMRDPAYRRRVRRFVQKRTAEHQK